MTKCHDNDDRLVKITIADKVVRVLPGEHSVAELKKLAGLANDDNLEELIGGRIKPLDDNGTTRIKGGEVFVVCGTGAAS